MFEGRRTAMAKKEERKHKDLRRSDAARKTEGRALSSRLCTRQHHEFFRCRVGCAWMVPELDPVSGKSKRAILLGVTYEL